MTDYWAVSASKGESRDFAKLTFFQYGIACVGGNEQIETSKEVKTGDVLILKKSCGRGGGGKFFIQSVGKVIAPFTTEGIKAELFDDVDGWDLSCVAVVEWFADKEFCSKDYPCEGLTQGTINRVHLDKPRELADKILKRGERIKPLESPQTPLKKIEMEQIVDVLLINGLSVSHAEDLVNAVKRVQRLAKYYIDVYKQKEKDGEKNKFVQSEDETRAFLVLPLLRALGWSEQKMSLERKCDAGELDISLYKTNHDCSKDANPYIIIEVKKMFEGLDKAQEQAKKYFSCLPDCQYCVVTNGYSYQVYAREKDDFIAYMNITKLLEHFRFDDKIGGSKKVFEHLLPP